MKKLVIVTVLTAFFAATGYVPIASGQNDNKCCCSYKRDGRNMFRWMKMTKCKDIGGNPVYFGPTLGKTYSPKEQCNMVGKRLR